jgi:hypothetical protein
LLRFNWPLDGALGLRSVALLALVTLSCGFVEVRRGTGTWGPPVRLFAPPEITLITIASEEAK